MRSICLFLCVAACTPNKATNQQETTNTSEKPPTSDDLIAAAVAAGKLDAESALTYRVFADFGDERLPAEYRGGASKPCGSPVLEAAASPTVSEATRATLAPFFLPPSAPGSWRELATIPENGITPGRDAAEIAWTKFSAQGGKITVWAEDRHEGDAALAQQIAAEIDTLMWRKLVTELGMRPPMADGLHVNNGDSDSADIYIVRQGQNGIYGSVSRYRYPVACGSAKAVASYALINANAATGSKLMSTVAHELMHMMQAAYDNPCDSLWWREATGAWAEDFVYPDRNSEHEHAPPFFKELSKSLETQSTYAGYLLPFFVQRHYGRPKLVSRSFEIGETSPDSVTAIDQALSATVGESFAEVWPEFAQRNWNQAPVTDYYDWDALAVMPSEDVRQLVFAAPASEAPLPTKTSHLAATYLQIGVSDTATRQVILDNQIHSNQIPRGDVWLIARIGNEWKKPEVLGERNRFCKDKPEENVEQIVLIISNSEVTNRSYSLPDDQIRLTMQAAGCVGYAGTINLADSTSTSGATVTTAYNINVTYAPNPDTSSEPDGDPVPLERTTLSWNFHRLYDQPGRNPPCRTVETASRAGVYDGGPAMSDSGQLVIGPSGKDYFLALTLYNDAQVTQISNCNDENVDVTTVMPMLPAFFTSQGYVDFDEQGNAIGSTATTQGTLTWSLIR